MNTAFDPTEKSTNPTADRLAAQRAAVRRRHDLALDPASLFGVTVLSQLVATELALNPPDTLQGADDPQESGSDSDAALIEPAELDGLFGPALGGLGAPLLGTAAAVAGFPGSSSDLGGGSNTQASEAPSTPESNQQSVVLESSRSVRRGEAPAANGADSADPVREAGGAQAAGEDVQKEVTTSGGADPFGAALAANPDQSLRPTMAPAAGAGDSVGGGAGADAASVQSATLTGDGLAAPAQPAPMSSTASADPSADVGLMPMAA